MPWFLAQVDGPALGPARYDASLPGLSRDYKAWGLADWAAKSELGMFDSSQNNFGRTNGSCVLKLLGAVAKER